jgi:hypothetical protein
MEPAVLAFVGGMNNTKHPRQLSSLDQMVFSLPTFYALRASDAIPPEVLRFACGRQDELLLNP